MKSLQSCALVLFVCLSHSWAEEPVLLTDPIPGAPKTYILSSPGDVRIDEDGTVIYQKGAVIYIEGVGAFYDSKYLPHPSLLAMTKMKEEALPLTMPEEQRKEHIEKIRFSQVVAWSKKEYKFGPAHSSKTPSARD